MSQEALAAAAKITTSTLSNIESGKRNPRGSTLAKIIKALGISSHDLDEATKSLPPPNEIKLTLGYAALAKGNFKSDIDPALFSLQYVDPNNDFIFDMKWLRRPDYFQDIVSIEEFYQLRDGALRTVILYGPSGIGKTAQFTYDQQRRALADHGSLPSAVSIRLLDHKSQYDNVRNMSDILGDIIVGELGSEDSYQLFIKDNQSTLYFDGIDEHTARAAETLSLLERSLHRAGFCGIAYVASSQIQRALSSISSFAYLPVIEMANPTSHVVREFVSRRYGEHFLSRLPRASASDNDATLLEIPFYIDAICKLLSRGVLIGHDTDIVKLFIDDTMKTTSRETAVLRQDVTRFAFNICLRSEQETSQSFQQNLYERILLAGWASLFAYRNNELQFRHRLISEYLAAEYINDCVASGSISLVEGVKYTISKSNEVHELSLYKRSSKSLARVDISCEIVPYMDMKWLALLYDVGAYEYMLSNDRTYLDVVDDIHKLYPSLELRHVFLSHMDGRLAAEMLQSDLNSSFTEPKTLSFSIGNNLVGISQRCVTNYEWRQFIRDGGYDRIELWGGGSAALWLRNDPHIVGASRAFWRYFRRQDFEKLRRDWFDSSHKRRELEWVKSLTSEAYDKELLKWYPNSHKYAPSAWHDPKCTSALQPVVGVSFYEASAYARWVSLKSGRNFTLMSTTVWQEVAKLTLPNLAACNTVEEHIFAPICVWSSESSDNRLFDLFGNVWEWTNSAPNTHDLAELGMGELSTVMPLYYVYGGSWSATRSVVESQLSRVYCASERYTRLGFRLMESL